MIPTGNFTPPLAGGEIKHSAAAHFTEHPETPKVRAELRAHLLDEPLGVIRRSPRDDRLDRALEILRGHCADLCDVAVAKRLQDLRENPERLLPSLPLRGGTEQVFLRHHLENRPDVLRHAAVNEHERILQSLARLGGDFVLRENVVRRHQPAARDAVLVIAWLRCDALDQFDARPHPAAVLPATAATAEPFAEQRSREHEPALLFAQRAGERLRLAGGAHEHGDERGEQIRGNGEAGSLRNVVHRGDELDAATRPEHPRQQIGEALSRALNARRHNAGGNHRGLEKPR